MSKMSSNVWTSLLANYLEDTHDTASVLETIHKKWPKSIPSYISAVRREWLTNVATPHADFDESLEAVRVSFKVKRTADARVDEFKDADVKRKLEIQKKIRGAYGSFTGDADLDLALSKIEVLPDYIRKLRLTEQERQETRTRSKAALEQKNAKVKVVHYDLVRKAEGILDDANANAFDIAVAIGLVTGRRAVEILKTGKFTMRTADECTFSGQVKKGSVPAAPYRIPLLTTFARVQKAVARLRKQKPCDDLSNAEVNAKYANSLSTAVKRFFNEPYRFHDLRSAYAVICFHTITNPCFTLNYFASKVLGHSDLGESLHYNAWRVEGVPDNKKRKLKL